MIVARSSGPVKSASARKSSGSAARASAPRPVTRSQLSWAGLSSGRGSIGMMNSSRGRSRRTARTLANWPAFETMIARASESARMAPHCSGVSVA